MVDQLMGEKVNSETKIAASLKTANEAKARAEKADNDLRNLNDQLISMKLFIKIII